VDEPVPASNPGGRWPFIQTKNGGPSAAALLPLMIGRLMIGDWPQGYLISIPLFGQIHFLTSPPWISAFAWMVFTPKIVSAL
jgi:hypothetical protein